MTSPVWNHDHELSLVDGQACVWWLDLASPFGDAPTGVDWTLELPEGIQVLNPTARPRYGTGPDAHRPHIEHRGQAIDLDFTGYLPAENHRRPMTHHATWCDLHYPLVVIADGRADGAELVVHRRGLGDHDIRCYQLAVLDDPGLRPPPAHRLNVQPVFLPWFSEEEQAALASALRRCGVTDANLNWFTYGMPILPPAAYAVSTRILRREIPGVTVWIGGMPGADTALPRAEGVYGRHIPFLACPEIAVSDGGDLVIAAERTWCEVTGADGVMITMNEPVLTDGDPLPAHCFSYASRKRFAGEAGLEAVPDPMAIIQRHGRAWLEFCARQLRRLVETARRGHGSRPLALCMIGPHGTASVDAPSDWKVLGEIADVLITTHRKDDAVLATKTAGSDTATLRRTSGRLASAAAKVRWGHTRLGGLPQAWWEHWDDRLSPIEDPDLVVADMKMQLALSGSRGVRLWNWARIDGRQQHQLMGWR